MPASTETHQNIDEMFKPSPLPLAPSTRALFDGVNPSKFRSLSDEELGHHITEIRDELYAYKKFPCLGLFAFLEPGVKDGVKGTYEKVLKEMRSDPEKRLLDLGCCVGQDARQLALDGLPKEQIVASDLEQPFMDLGFKLFADRATFGSVPHIQADIFNPEDVAKVKKAGRKDGTGFDYIYVGSFIHLFDHDTQQRVCDIIGGQLLSSRPGSTLFGRQVGASTSGHLEFKGGWKKNGKEASETTHKMFRHNDESFSKMWKQDEYEVEAQIRRWHNELRNDGVAASTREWILFDVVRK